jgi:hypothetical protein
MRSLPTKANEAPEHQRRVALAKANQVRTRRAALKAELKRGDLSAAALITEPPRCLATAKITELLRALPGYGPVNVERVLKLCQVSPRRSVGGLSARQRGELVKALERTQVLTNLTRG